MLREKGHRIVKAGGRDIVNSRGKHFLEIIHKEILIGDGALGTEILKTAGRPVCIECMNLDAPLLVKRLHEDYISAGSRVIETNSFGANRINLSYRGLGEKTAEINRAAVKLAQEAASGMDIFIAGSIGPVNESRNEEKALSSSDKQAALLEQAMILAEAGADILILETFTDIEEISLLIRGIRGFTDMPVIAQMAFEEGGLTPYGEDGSAAAAALTEAGADVIGANCGGGVPAVMKAVAAMRPAEKPLSAFLNAGFAEQAEGRRIFAASDLYLAQRAAELAHLGVRLIGGCCGTTAATIRAIASILKNSALPVKRISLPISERKPAVQHEPIRIPKGVLVEIDPPRDLQMASIHSCTKALTDAGIKHITIADNPLASVRVDNITVAGMLLQEFGAVPIPHITSRDRNRIALQSAVMGAHCVGIRHLLCVTGDPVRMYHEANTSGVFDVNSVSLVKLISEFNLGQRLNPDNRTSFAIGVAFNPNVRSLDGQINKLLRKIEAGAHFALTQPVYSAGRLEATLEAFSRHHIDIPVFCGIMPLTSGRNAEYLHNEVPGIVIPDEFREKLGRFKDLADQKRVAMELAVTLAGQCLELNRLFYIITPRNDASFVLPIIEFLKVNGVKMF